MDESYENYKRICNACYLAKKVGFNITFESVRWNDELGMAYSPMIECGPGGMRWNLKKELWNLRYELRGESDFADDWELCEEDRKKLEQLKESEEYQRLVVNFMV